MRQRVLYPAITFVVAMALFVVLAARADWSPTGLAVGIFVVTMLSYAGRLAGLAAERRASTSRGHIDRPSPLHAPEPRHRARARVGRV